MLYQEVGISSCFRKVARWVEAFMAADLEAAELITVPGPAQCFVTETSKAEPRPAPSP